jgi:pSer/pThr/pTyr-binding forkhead associated (FHA) protein
MLQVSADGHGRTSCPVLRPLTLLDTRPIRIDRQACILGTHARVHLPLLSPIVSRAHALIVTCGDEAYVRDLASRNGVYVNGQIVRESRLRHADLLCIGPYAFWWGAMPPPSPRPRHLADGPESHALLAVRGERAPRTVEGRTFLIGGRAGCDLMLDSDWVDACHAVIYRRGDSFHLRDLNSRSGSFVNGRRVRKAELRRGDEIRIGLTFIRFEPPEKWEDGTCENAADLAGLAAATMADQPLEGHQPVRSCPTIEQLLGAPSDRITHWENPALIARRNREFSSFI